MGRLQRVVAHVGPRMARDLASRFTTVSLPHAPPGAPDPPRSRPAASSEPSNSQMLLSLSDALAGTSRQVVASPLTPLVAALVQAQSWLAQPGLPASTPAHTSSLDSLLQAVSQQHPQPSASGSAAMQSLLLALQPPQQQPLQQQPLQQQPLQQLAIALQSAQMLAAMQADHAAPAQLHATTQPQALDQPRLEALRHMLRLARLPVSGPMALSKTTGRDHSQRTCVCHGLVMHRYC